MQLSFFKYSRTASVIIGGLLALGTLYDLKLRKQKKKIPVKNLQFDLACKDDEDHLTVDAPMLEEQKLSRSTTVV